LEIVYRTSNTAEHYSSFYSLSKQKIVLFKMNIHNNTASSITTIKINEETHTPFINFYTIHITPVTATIKYSSITFRIVSTIIQLWNEYIIHFSIKLKNAEITMIAICISFVHMLMKKMKCILIKDNFSGLILHCSKQSHAIANVIFVLKRAALAQSVLILSQRQR